MDFPVKEIGDEMNRILDFWVTKTVDSEEGGFFGQISGLGEVNQKADKGVILNTRLLWTFSAAARHHKQDNYLPFAERAYHYLLDHFWDEPRGGLFWILDYQGNLKDTKKQIYAQAFGIYGLSEFYQLTRNEEALQRAIHLFHLIEQHSYDPDYGGYLEAFDSDWKLLQDVRLSNKDANALKTMNTHLHILEAYTNLYRCWKAPELHARLELIIQLFLKRIINLSTGHMHLFFSKNWNTEQDPISYGHDIEASWLLQEAAEVLADQELLAAVHKLANQMAEVTLQEGLGAQGQTFYERHPNGETDKEAHWWCQAEAMVGFLYAWRRTQNDHYLQAAHQCWIFIKENLLDRAHGEWYWSIRANGEVNIEDDKVGPWKAPYHNVRACLEVLNFTEH